MTENSARHTTRRLAKSTKYSVLVCLMTVFAVACSSAPQTYTAEYQQALTTFSGEQLDEQQVRQSIDKFSALFNNLADANVDDVLTVYADQLYFNDTISLLSSSQQVRAHFLKMADQVDAINFKVINRSYSLDKPNDYFVYWKIDYTLKFLGAKSNVVSYGMSHLRFNKQGQIVLHQDFWDSNNGFYYSLPYMKILYKKLLPFKRN